MSDEPYDAGSYRSVREKKKASRIEENLRLEALRLIMSQPNGRAFILWMLDKCNIFHSGFATNALIMAFNSGERNVGLQLFNDVVTYCSDDYIKMMKERTQREVLRNGRRTDSNTDTRTDFGTAADTSADSEPDAGSDSFA